LILKEISKPKIGKNDTFTIGLIFFPIAGLKSDVIIVTYLNKIDSSGIAFARTILWNAKKITYQCY